MSAPVLIKPIPDQQANIHQPFKTLDLTSFFQNKGNGKLRFQAVLENGDYLPVGMICTREGLLSGFPGEETAGDYVVLITVENDEGSVQASFHLKILAEEKKEKVPGSSTAPASIKKVPTQIINEHAAYGPFALKDFFQGEALSFSAELTNGKALPQGLICTADGVLTGIPAAGTQGNHEVKVTAKNGTGQAEAVFLFVIKPSLAVQREGDYLDQIKAQVWEALENRLPMPDIASLYDQVITKQDIAYLLERWGFLAIWDAFNLEAPSEKKLLHLEGVSPHYDVYDRGCCLIASPKDLYSHERTLEDSLQTARAVAREVYERNWTIEITGVAKMSRAAWVEVQHLGDRHGRQLEVINFSPTPDDVKLYVSQSVNRKMGL